MRREIRPIASLVFWSLAWAQPVCPPEPLLGIENEQSEGFSEPFLDTPEKRKLVVNIALLRIESGYFNPYIPRRDWSRFVNKALAATNEHAFYDAMRQWIGELALLDGQSQFFSARQMQAQDKEWPRAGITLAGTLPNPVYVVRLDPGGPAERAGIQVHDKILAVDGEPCWNIEMIRGEAGTEITLTVQTANQAPRDLTIARELLKYTPFKPLALRVPANPKVGYVWINGGIWSAGEAKPLIPAFEQLASGPTLEGLILDMRGSSINDREAIETLMSPFVAGVSYRIMTDPETPYSYFVPPSTLKWAKLTLVVLVDSTTAGLGVWVAGILQRRTKTLLVGKPTQPMDLASNSSTLPDGSHLNYPAVGFRFADGSGLFNGRVVPSILMAENWLDYSQAEDPYIKAALDALKKTR